MVLRQICSRHLVSHTQALLLWTSDACSLFVRLFYNCFSKRFGILLYLGPIDSCFYLKHYGFLYDMSYNTRTRQFGRRSGVDMTQHGFEYGIRVGYVNRHLDTARSRKRETKIEREDGLRH